MKMNKPNHPSLIRDNPAPLTLNTGPSFPKNKIEPLTRQFYGRLAKLETDFRNKNYTLETLDELTQLYARAVEYYDSIRDEIASYFIFKIQDALATKKSLKILMTNEDQDAAAKSNGGNKSPILNRVKKFLMSSNSNRNGQIIKESLEEAEEASDSEEDRKVMEDKKKNLAGKPNEIVRMSISKIKNKRQRDVALYCKVEKEKKTEKQNLNKTLEAFSQSVMDNDSLVKTDVESQKNRLRQKLEQRKQQSFNSQTLTTTSFFALNKSLPQNLIEAQKRNEYSRLENVLEELDNLDDIISNKDKLDGYSDLEEGKTFNFGNKDHQIQSLKETPIKRYAAKKMGSESPKSSGSDKAEEKMFERKEENQEDRKVLSAIEINPENSIKGRSNEVFKKILQTIEKLDSDGIPIEDKENQRSSVVLNKEMKKKSNRYVEMDQAEEKLDDF